VAKLLEELEEQSEDIATASGRLGYLLLLVVLALLVDGCAAFLQFTGSLAENN
jgi:hypothetical protein